MGRLVGTGPAMQGLYRMIEMAAPTPAPVLITGESGTGKELVARTIHELSPRAQAPFVAVNCAAIPETLLESEIFGHEKGAFTGALERRAGCFELAHQGTLFLDEIGDASALLQMKLLRVLQEGEARRVGETRLRRLDVRVVSATHRNLAEGVEGGGFRADLYYRLNAVRLRLPPLRERGDDVLLLAAAFLRRAAADCCTPPPALDPELAAHLLRHPWPGNVRELSNGCAYAVKVGGAREQVALEHWPETPLLPGTPAERGLHAETRALEERRLREALEQSRGNKSQAARSLGLSRQGLLKKLRRYGLGPAEPAPCTLDGPGVAP
jgi:DNA-binding NtrC family response regulator